ncbi:hypothetical protein VaNZ11_011171 [Volvox africanus]|uniref:F-box domain-containing protein n=1 Tax=Volvox africanus TaxID=51714 RepID=A0ABQ5SBF4_9CHLO|nr:hypothetical protein VaNZ11_011171 [Volvox africanus]
MAPKKRQAKASIRKKRILGVLGAPIYDSDEDEDWKPNDQSSIKFEPIFESRQLRQERREQAVQPAHCETGLEDVPLSLRRRKAQNRSGICDTTRVAEQTDTGLPHHPPDERKRRKRGEETRALSTSTHARSTSVGEAAAPGARLDWSCLTEPLLVAVLRHACAVSALPTAASAACVCRHWRDVCKNLEETVKAAAAAAAAVALVEAEEEAEAAAAEAAAAARSAAMAVAAAKSVSALRDVMGDEASMTTTDASTTTAAAWMELGGGVGSSGRSPCGGAGNLWSCLDVRSQPSIHFTNEVVHRGLASGRWSQVQTLKLRTCTGLTPDGLLALIGGCPGLTCLELCQCESLVKIESMRAVLSSLPRLRVLDLSHNAVGVMDHLLKLALAPRHRPHQQQQQQEQQGRQQVVKASARGEGSAAGAGGRSSRSAADGNISGPSMLPCPLQVLRVRGCARLGPAALRALSPSVPYVTFPSQQQQQQLPPDDGVAGAPAEPMLIPLFVHLTELDLTGSGSLTSGGLLSVEKLQAAAPNLRVLRLDATASAQHSGLRLAPEPESPGPGFPRLRLCELGLSRIDQGMEQHLSRRQGCTVNMLRRLVGGSPRLRVLDVSGTQSIEDKRLLDSLEADVEADTAAETRAAAAAAAESAAMAVYMRPGRDDRPTGLFKMFPNDPEVTELRMARSMQSLGPALQPVLVGPLQVLRARKSVLATDAGLHALAARFGGTLRVMDVSESSHVTDAGLLHVALNCTALTALDVSSTLITNFGVRVLMALRYAGSEARMAKAGSVSEADDMRPSGSSGTATAMKEAAISRHAPVVHNLVSDDDDEGEEVDGVGTRHLRDLNINSCRGVDRSTRHAAAMGLDTLWRALNHNR